MQLPTHILAGWCLSNLLKTTRRERLFAMVVSLAPDLDGLSLILGKGFYLQYHHRIGHNLLVGLLLAFLLALFCSHRRKMFFLFICLFHLHLVMDYLGSGPGWPIDYFWPFLETHFINPHAWSFNGWQNALVFVFFLWWAFFQIKQKKRSPFELLWPKLDWKLVEKAEREFNKGNKTRER